MRRQLQHVHVEAPPAPLAVCVVLPHPTLPDTFLLGPLFALSPPAAADLPQFAWFWCLAAVAAASALPVMRLLWLEHGSGNANFYFNMVRRPLTTPPLSVRVCLCVPLSLGT